MGFKATRDYGERAFIPRAARPQRVSVSESLRRFVRFIPLYPESISGGDLRKKARLSEGELRSLITSATVNYALCEDEGRYSLLRRGRINVG